MIHNSFQNFHRKILLRALANNGDVRLSETVFAQDRLSFHLVGYSSDRWIKYVDAYLYGGPKFLEFLRQPTSANSVTTFTFGGNSRHGKGPCILTMSLTKQYVHLNARILHWANAGILDLNLAWFLCRHYHRPVWITCPSVKVLDWQLAGYSLLNELPRTFSIVKKAHALRKNPEALTFDRHFKKATRTFDHRNMDEEEIVLNFPRITPEDIAKHLRIKGTKLRNVLRREFGHAIKGDQRNSHSWASYSDPRFLVVAKALDINIRKLPSIASLVEKRQ